jgi:acetoin utilization protein AcuB
MKTGLTTVPPDTPVSKAREIMDSKRISHLPVLGQQERLLGLVTDRDVREAWASPASTLSVHELFYVLQNLTVESIMKKKLITATPDMTIERAAFIIHENRIGALPVVMEGKLVGLITASDLTEVLLQALGMGEDSTRLSLVVRDRIGVIAEIGNAMRQAGINIRSIITIPLESREGLNMLNIRVNVNMADQAAQLLRDSGFKVLTEYVEDLTPYYPAS